MRVGMGYDVHQLVEGRKLILGGVEIPYEKGLKGHSDADVLLHAIIESIIEDIKHKRNRKENKEDTKEMDHTIWASC